MRVMNDNWSDTKQRLHPQSVAEISCHSVFSGDWIQQHMFTLRSRDAIKVTWKTCHFRHLTSEHYRVSKSEIFGKAISAADF